MSNIPNKSVVQNFIKYDMPILTEQVSMVKAKVPSYQFFRPDEIQGIAKKISDKTDFVRQDALLPIANKSIESKNSLDMYF